MRSYYYFQCFKNDKGKILVNVSYYHDGQVKISTLASRRDISSMYFPLRGLRPGDKIKIPQLKVDAWRMQYLQRVYGGLPMISK